MERLTMTSEKGGVAFTFDLDINCRPSEAMKILKLAEKLKVYEDAEEQGVLLRLPCKIGDSLYQPIHKDINEYKVIGICFDITKNEWLFEVAIQIGLEWIKIVCEFSCIGKTVFLTKEEAEQALKQMGE